MPGYNYDGKRVIPESDHPVLGERYRAGETLQQIADTYGVSRERIRQLLRKTNVDGAEGGSAKTARISRLKRKADRDRRMLEKYGCTVAEWRYLTTLYNPSPLYYYRNQKYAALDRGIEWNLSFWEWWTIWDESGKWEQRGREYGQYVMARYGDKGAYEVGNVHIVTCTENIIEYCERRYGGDYSETVTRAISEAA